MARRPHLALDIGAHHGGMSARMAPHVREVHAFEPLEDNLRRLRALAAAVPNIKVFETAVSNQEGAAVVDVYNVWSLVPSAEACDRGLERAVEYAGLSPFEVRMTTVDAHCEKHGLPGFIKIDVDGYEYRVLEGAASTLARSRCPLHFEYSYLPEKCLGESVRGMCRFIYSLGYQAWSEDGTYVAETAEEMWACYPEHTSFDIFLVHRDDTP